MERVFLRKSALAKRTNSTVFSQIGRRSTARRKRVFDWPIRINCLLTSIYDSDDGDEERREACIKAGI